MAELTKKSLGTMNKDELRQMCKDIEIEFLETDTNKTLEEKIVESGRYASAKETTTGAVIKDGKKYHKTLGEYIKVRVHPTAEHNQKTSIFVSINLYTVEFQPNEIVSLPKAVVKFLKQSGDAEHYFDKNFITENGNRGAHRTRMRPKYIVELVDEDLE